MEGSAAINNNRTKWVSIRMLPGEYDQLMADYRQTIFRNSSDYIRSVLLGKKVTVMYRNSSLDDVMEELILLTKELNAIGNNLNQVARRINTCQDDRVLKAILPAYAAVEMKLLTKIEEIKSKIHQCADLWSQE